MTLRALLMGHSILHWLEYYLRTRQDRRLSTDFKLSRIMNVAFRSERGRTVRDMLRFDMREVSSISPHVVVLLIGGNDVQWGSEPAEVAHRIIAMCTIFYRVYRVKQVVVCRLMPRFEMRRHRFVKHGQLNRQERRRDRAFKSMYCEKAQEINSIIATEAINYPFLTVWDHNGKFPFPSEVGNGQQCRDKFSSDGIHLTPKGQYHLYNSIRGCLIYAAAQVR